VDFESYRPLLFSIAYRMLGSVADAEDMVQDTYLRVEAFSQEKIDNMRAYLCTVSRIFAWIIFVPHVHVAKSHPE
jgi:RNA polymerase sigma-70 factor, ECF subfamily